MISVDNYSDMDEINYIRQSIMNQFEALKDRKLIINFDDSSNRIIIRVNDRSYNQLMNAIDYN